ncbi:MAG TPA: hypothetical protein VN889_02375, partial [Solirubrobacteraceae bacterium]|nr:hypothetical protein [Solirubrobacteraceae bacterium]
MDSLFDPEPQDRPPREARADGERTAQAGDDASAGDIRPLAVRVRPRSLDEFVGQSHLLKPGSALRTAIEQGRA